MGARGESSSRATIRAVPPETCVYCQCAINNNKQGPLATLCDFRLISVVPHEQAGKKYSVFK